MKVKQFFQNIGTSLTNTTKLIFSKAYREELGEIETKRQFSQLKSFFLKNGLYIAIVIYIIVVSIIQPSFLGFSSIVNNINQFSSRLPVALGIAGLIIINATDLSAGRTLGITALITASLMQQTGFVGKIFPNIGEFNVFVTLLIAVGVGALIAFVNGFFVAKFKIHPFIVTLGMQLILQSAALLFLNIGTNNSQPLGTLSQSFKNLITGGIVIGGAKIQWIVIYAIIITAIMWFIWNKTVFGKNIFAIGSNPEAATVSGINVSKMIILTFVMAGVLFGLNGFLEAGYVGSATASSGVGAEFDAIAACVIGGISFSGGIGKIRGVVIGVLLLQLITTSLIFLGVAPEWGYAIKGAVIIITVAIDMRKSISRK